MKRHHDNKDSKDETYGDSDFLAYRDIAINDFRKDEKESKTHLIKKMLELRHNMKYNKHLLSVYLKAKQLFDNMVEEHRSQIFYLEEIYSHINNLIRENHTNPQRKNNLTSELVKDKKRIGLLLKKMRNSYEKLTNVYTVIDVTIQKMDEIIASIEEAEADTDVDFDEDDAAELDSDADDAEDAELDSDAELELDSEDDEAELDSEDDEAELDSEDDEAELDSEDDEAELDSDDDEAELDSDDDEAELDSDDDEAELDSEDDEAELDSEADEAELDSEADEDEPVIMIY